MFAHGFAGFFVQKWGWCLFDDLLVAALDRTFPLAQIDAVTVAVTEYLNFDMTRLGNKFFDENPIIPKGIRRLILGRLKTLAGLAVVPCYPHAFTAAARRGFDHHRITNLIGNLDRLVSVLNQAHISGNRTNVGLLCDFFGRNFIAHVFYRAFWWPDKCDACRLKGLSEFWVL